MCSLMIVKIAQLQKLQRISIPSWIGKYFGEFIVTYVFKDFLETELHGFRWTILVGILPYVSTLPPPWEVTVNSATLRTTPLSGVWGLVEGTES